jgi:hypothetical protein
MKAVCNMVPHARWLGMASEDKSGQYSKQGAAISPTHKGESLWHWVS